MLIRFKPKGLSISRSWQYLLIPVFALTPFASEACSPIPRTIEENEEIARKIGETGVVIRGTLIQAFDAEKQQPEIIRADEIYIGDKEHRQFVIYRHKRTYESALNPQDFIFPCGGPISSPEVGHVYDLLVLTPAKGKDPATNGRWTFSGNSVTRGRELELLEQAATEVGRFQARPPEQ